MITYIIIKIANTKYTQSTAKAASERCPNGPRRGRPKFLQYFTNVKNQHKYFQSQMAKIPIKLTINYLI